MSTVLHASLMPFIDPDLIKICHHIIVEEKSCHLLHSNIEKTKIERFEPVFKQLMQSCGDQSYQMGEEETRQRCGNVRVAAILYFSFRGAVLLLIWNVFFQP